MFTCVLGRCVASTVVLISIETFRRTLGEQLLGDRDQRPFSGVTSSGRVWREVLST